MKKKRILIVDDDAGMRSSLVFAMEWKGFDVTAAADGEEALQQILGARRAERLFDLLICDIFIPKITGDLLIQLLNVLKISIPVVVISGAADKQLIVQLMRLGCRNFFEKPFVLEEFEAHIEQLLVSSKAPGE